MECGILNRYLNCDCNYNKVLCNDTFLRSWSAPNLQEFTRTQNTKKRHPFSYNYEDEGDDNAKEPRTRTHYYAMHT